METIVQELKKTFNKAGGLQPHLLAVFNHLEALTPETNWIVIPLRIGIEPFEMKGTIRVLYDVFLKKIRKLVIVIQADERQRFHFVLFPKGNAYRLSVYSNQRRLVGAGLGRFRENIRKLSNLGVHCDDIILDEGYFDGFDEEPSAPVYRSIDTKG